MKKKQKPEIESSVSETVEYANWEYPADEDIYTRNEKFLFVEEATDAGIDDDKSDHALIGDDLDVPGAELDDASEETGAEDEENNYYSLGGDNHS